MIVGWSTPSTRRNWVARHHLAHREPLLLSSVALQALSRATSKFSSSSVLSLWLANCVKGCVADCAATVGQPTRSAWGKRIARHRSCRAHGRVVAANRCRCRWDGSLGASIIGTGTGNATETGDCRKSHINNSVCPIRHYFTALLQCRGFACNYSRK